MAGYDQLKSEVSVLHDALARRLSPTTPLQSPSTAVNLTKLMLEQEMLKEGLHVMHVLLACALALPGLSGVQDGLLVKTLIKGHILRD